MINQKLLLFWNTGLVGWCNSNDWTDELTICPTCKRPINIIYDRFLYAYKDVECSCGAKATVENYPQHED